MRHNKVKHKKYVYMKITGSYQENVGSTQIT